jgi:hypothetical protein
MKVNQLVLKLYEAILSGNKAEEKRLWEKSLKKSLKGKRTQIVK